MNFSRRRVSRGKRKRKRESVPIVAKSTSKYLRRNLVTPAASGKARKIHSTTLLAAATARKTRFRSFDVPSTGSNANTGSGKARGAREKWPASVELFGKNAQRTRSRGRFPRETLWRAGTTSSILYGSARTRGKIDQLSWLGWLRIESEKEFARGIYLCLSKHAKDVYVDSEIHWQNYEQLAERIVGELWFWCKSYMLIICCIKWVEMVLFGH